MKKQKVLKVTEIDKMLSSLLDFRIKSEERKTSYFFFVIGIFLGILGNLLADIILDSYNDAAQFVFFELAILLSFISVVLWAYIYYKDINDEIVGINKTMEYFEKARRGEIKIISIPMEVTKKPKA